LALTSKIPIAVIGLIAVIGGLGTGMATSLGLAPDSPFQGEPDPEAMAEGEEPLEIHALGDFVINLNEPGGARLLRMKLEVEATPSTAVRIEEIRPRLRDDIIRWTSDRTYASIEGGMGKEELRTELLARVNTILEPQRVEQVFFHSFVVQ
jgi:flagellar basal body-associated protein FliL